MMSSLTINNSGAPRNIRHKQLGLSNRLPAAVTGGPALIGGVAMNDGLTIPDIAMRVGGAVALCVGQQDVIVHSLSAMREELLVLIESDKSQLESATCVRLCTFVCRNAKHFLVPSSHNKALVLCFVIYCQPITYHIILDSFLINASKLNITMGSLRLQGAPCFYNQNNNNKNNKIIEIISNH